MDLLELWEQMGLAVKSLMGVLAIMSMWSVGVFFERLFTFTQAPKCKDIRRVHFHFGESRRVLQRTMDEVDSKMGGEH